MRLATIKKYLVPGFVFQSVIIAGGYGTGRELVEFFMVHGPRDGMLGMLVAMLLWSIVLAVSFEFGRVTQSFDYRSFLQNLLGRGWILYEVLYAATLLLILAVIGSAAGLLFHQACGLPPALGAIGFAIAISMLVFLGSRWIERCLTFGSAVLYITFAALVVCVFFTFGDAIRQHATLRTGDSGALLSGIKYAAYNVGIIPALLFSIRRLETRPDAIIAGLLAGPIAMIPAILLYVAMLSHYPAIVSEAIPLDHLLRQLGFPVFQVFFSIVLIGTFIETGSCLVHGFNERLARAYQEKDRTMPKILRPAVAIGLLVAAIVLASQIGLIALIGKGYGMITWFYLFIFVVPLLTVGIRRIV